MEDRQVQARFTTKLGREFEVPKSTFAIPAHLSRYGLSETINVLLGLEKPQPFDFLVDGELLRASIEQLLIDKKISAETVVNIEYIQAVAPPQQELPRLHKDWVSAVDGSIPGFIFTGSYDCTVRIWDKEGLCIAQLEGHKDAISSVASAELSTSGSSLVVSASKDRSLRIWELSTSEDEETGTATVSIKRPIKVLKGHVSSVQCVSLSPSLNLVCSGSWDSSLKVWPISTDADTEAVVNKRRKLDESEDTAEDQEIEVEAHTTLQGHSQCVTAVVWHPNDSIYSASWDHSIRSWDVETGVNSTVVTCNKALQCLSVGGEASCLLAAGGADPVLRIWDPRMPGSVSPVLQLSSHKLWITACKWHPQSTYHIMSASHDGSIKLWDIRSKIPLHTVEAHKDKVLCADWWRNECIVSGGADNQLSIAAKLDLI